MKDAQQLFVKTFATSLARFISMGDFLTVSHSLLKSGAPAVHADSLQTVQEIFEGPDSDRFFTDGEYVRSAAGGTNAIAQHASLSRLKKFRTTTDSAAFVFAHSILDAALYDYCRCTALADPGRWARLIPDKKIVLLRVLQEPANQILLDVVKDYVQNLERQSMVHKTDKLMQVCSPDREIDPPDDYSFDRTRLESLDKARHKIVHGSGPANWTSARDDIWYLQQTSVYFMALLNHTFDFRMDPKEFLRLLFGNDNATSEP
jgi:hypothetical protein